MGSRTHWEADVNGTSSTATPSTSPLARLVRLLWPRGNPLVRGTDRVEAVTLVAAVLIGLLLLPIMLVVGSVTYADVIEKSQEQGRTRHEAVATLLQDAPSKSIAARGVTTSSAVRATWQLPDGSTRTGTVQVSDGLRAGAKVDIWLDDQGRVVTAPVSSTDAVWVAAVVAACGWLAVVGLLAVAQFGIHQLLDRRRHRGWGQEWERVAEGWDRPTGGGDARRH
jgi:hypothetical protein